MGSVVKEEKNSLNKNLKLCALISSGVVGVFFPPIGIGLGLMTLNIEDNHQLKKGTLSKILLSSALATSITGLVSFSVLPYKTRNLHEFNYGSVNVSYFENFAKTNLGLSRQSNGQLNYDILTKALCSISTLCLLQPVNRRETNVQIYNDGVSCSYNLTGYVDPLKIHLQSSTPSIVKVNGKEIKDNFNYTQTCSKLFDSNLIKS